MRQEALGYYHMETALRHILVVARMEKRLMGNVGNSTIRKFELIMDLYENWGAGKEGKHAGVLVVGYCCVLVYSNLRTCI